MARYYGKVGFGVTKEDSAKTGKWSPEITERPYYGDVLRDSRRLDTNEQLNPNITAGNLISIVADAYAMANYRDMQYIEWNGGFWIPTNVEVQAPRLIIRLGGVYDGPTAPAPQPPSGDNE